MQQRFGNSADFFIGIIQRGHEFLIGLMFLLSRHSRWHANKYKGSRRTPTEVLGWRASIMAAAGVPSAMGCRWRGFAVTSPSDIVDIFHLVLARDDNLRPG